ncbi:MAG: hypothetical protein ACYCPF_18465 [Streptosporangiaceae bacterium]
MSWRVRPRGIRLGQCLAVAGLLAVAGCGTTGRAAARKAPAATGAGTVFRACDFAAAGASAGVLPPRLVSLSAVAGTRQGWAAGQCYTGQSGELFASYLLRFSGRYWAAAAPVGPGIQIDGVSAVSGDTAWVWGTDQVGGPPYLGWVSGGAVRQVRPALLSGVKVLFMASAGASDTWLAGAHRGWPGHYRGLVIARWNGTSWRRLPVPPGARAIWGLATSGPAGAWAVVSKGFTTGTWLARWNGTAWTTMYAPPAGLSRANAQPDALSVASSGSRAWVVFNEVSTADPEGHAGPAPQAFSQYFDGHAWRPIPVPAGVSTLTGAIASGAGAWAIANFGTARARVVYSRLGGSWRPAPSTAAGPGCGPGPSALSAASPDYVIAISASLSVGCERSLGSVYDRGRWLPVTRAPG